jgi:uridine phosphorylase
VTSTSNPADRYPLLAAKAYGQPSVFQPENLLREARRQKQLPDVGVPAVCLLDPDGDVVRHLAATGTGRRHPGWACYHTDMWVTELSAAGSDKPTPELGVVGCAVGAPFAVLVAEQLHASGADLVISITSAGQLTALSEPPYFVLIDRAIRDEGTSSHYLPPAPWAHLPAHLRQRLAGALAGAPEPILPAPSWTTDAPYRETATAIDAARAAGAVCVEMEAAALYAYATARRRDVVCLAHVTNTMATTGDDFEKGHANGAMAALAVTATIARTLHPTRPRPDKD